MYKNTCTVHARKQTVFHLIGFCLWSKNLTWKHICLQSTCFSPLKLLRVVFIDIEVMESACQHFFHHAKYKQKGIV